MDLSIIVPIFNTEITKLVRCLDSIAQIGQVCFECILVDDGSADYVKTFCKEYAGRDPRFIYCRKENGGVSSARNLGIATARGRYICFVDSDDAIDPTYYSLPAKLDFQYDIIITDLLEIFGKRESLWSAFDQQGEISCETALFQACLEDKLNGPVCKFIRSDFLHNAGVCFREQLIHGEDAAFLFDMLCSRPSIYYFPGVSYYYFHDYANGRERFLRNPRRCVEDEIFLYELAVACIYEFDFAPEDRLALIANRKQRLIQGLFRRVLDGVECKIEMNAINSIVTKGIIRMREDQSARLDAATQLRKILLMCFRGGIMQGIVLIRRLYHGKKGIR